MRLEACIGPIKRRRDAIFELEELEVHDVYHLSIIKAHADPIDLLNTINHPAPSRMEIGPGTRAPAMVLDSLSRRPTLPYSVL